MLTFSHSFSACSDSLANWSHLSWNPLICSSISWTCLSREASMVARTGPPKENRVRGLARLKERYWHQNRILPELCQEPPLPEHVPPPLAGTLILIAPLSTLALSMGVMLCKAISILDPFLVPVHLGFIYAYYLFHI